MNIDAIWNKNEIHTNYYYKTSHCTEEINAYQKKCLYFFKLEMVKKMIKKKQVNKK